MPRGRCIEQQAALSNGADCRDRCNQQREQGMREAVPQRPNFMFQFDDDLPGRSRKR